MIKSKERSVWKSLSVLFIIIPTFVSFVSLIYFGSLAFILSSPYFKIYLNTLKFRVGLISASLGYMFIVMTIWFKGINYVFGENNHDKR